jgi:hypothetical protein
VFFRFVRLLFIIFALPKSSQIRKGDQLHVLKLFRLVARETHDQDE